MTPEEIAALQAQAKANAEAAAKAQAEAQAAQAEAKANAEAKAKADAELADLKKAAMDEHQRAILEAQEQTKKSFEPKEQELTAAQARIKTFEDKFSKLLEAEVADIPEDKRKLIPNLGTAEDKLEWVKSAKAAGMFGPPTKPTSTTSTPKTPTGEETPKVSSYEQAKADRKKFIAETNKQYNLNLRV